MTLLLCSDVVRLGNEGILSVWTKVPDLGLGLSAHVTGIAHPLPNSMVRALPQNLLSQTGLEALLILPQSSGDVVHGRAHCQSEVVWWVALCGINVLCGKRPWAAPCRTQMVPVDPSWLQQTHCRTLLSPSAKLGASLGKRILRKSKITAS